MKIYFALLLSATLSLVAASTPTTSNASHNSNNTNMQEQLRYMETIPPLPVPKDAAPGRYYDCEPDLNIPIAGKPNIPEVPQEPAPVEPSSPEKLPILLSAANASDISELSALETQLVSPTKFYFNNLHGSVYVQPFSLTLYYYPVVHIYEIREGSTPAEKYFKLSPTGAAENNQYTFSKGSKYVAVVGHDATANVTGWKTVTTGNFYLYLNTTGPSFYSLLKDKTFPFEIKHGSGVMPGTAGFSTGYEIKKSHGGRNYKVGVFNVKMTPYLNENARAISMYANEGEDTFCGAAGKRRIIVQISPGESTKCAGSEPDACSYRSDCNSNLLVGYIDEMLKAKAA